jgi:hypothetical protein
MQLYVPLDVVFTATSGVPVFWPDVFKFKRIPMKEREGQSKYRQSKYRESIYRE